MRMNSKFTTLTKNTGIFALANLAARVINLLLLPLYTNVLSTYDYGQAEIILNCANLVMPFVSLSISDAFLRFGLDENCDYKGVLRTTSRVLIISSACLLILSPLFSLYSGIGNYYLLFSILCLTQMVRNTYCLYAKIKNRNDIFGIDTVVYTFSLGISNVILLVICKLQIAGYVLAYIIANLCSVIFLSFRLKIFRDLKEGSYNSSLLRQMLEYSIPMIANAISWWILQFSDRLMLEFFLSNSEVGVYSAAAKIPNILSMIVGVFSQAWMLSSITEYKKEGSSVFYSSVLELYLLILTFSSVALIIIVKPMMTILVGKEFRQSWQYVPFLIVGAFYGSISSFAAPFFSAAKKNISITVTTMIASIVNIILNAILIPVIGTMGAVLSTMIAYFIVGIIRIYKSKRYVDFNIPHVKLWVSGTITLLTAILVLLQDRINMMLYYLMLFIIILFTIILYMSDIKAIITKMRRGNYEKE